MPTSLIREKLTEHETVLHEPLLIEQEYLIMPLAERAASTHKPIILTKHGAPVAALIGYAELSELYNELRCLRVLYNTQAERLGSRKY